MIIKNSLLYISSSIFSKAIPFLLLPILTHYLSPEEFGLFSIYQVLLAFAVALLGMALQTNISVNYFKVDKPQLGLYFGNIFAILFFNVLLGILIVTIYGFFKKDFFSINLKYLYLLPFLVLITTIVEIYTTLLRSQKKALKFVCIEVSNTLVRFGFVCLFIILCDWGWESFPIGSLIGLTIASVYCLYSLYIQNYIKLQYDKEKIKNILYMCVPLIPHTIGGMTIAMSDRLFIERIEGMHEVGIYSVGYSFGMILALFSDAFIKAWGPWFYEKMSSLTKEYEIKIVKATYAYIIGILLCSLVVYSISLILIPLLTAPEFHEATKYVFWIAFAYSIQGIYKIFFPFLVHFSKTKFLAITTVIAAIISLICNYYFIHAFGAIGAAYSTTLAYSVSTIGVIIIANKQIKLPWLNVFSK
ncbi:lipopolysaccharide biosynthesis protein [Acinetobacter baumannii]|uniref:lipopolysaccharide biosynthesis protein n=1 Tax=Acinetobacter baumannii TaxID=470 RepID=UPI000BF7301E|nr:oligosaccharide flippase family protein [Acinetobacter baumannii]MDC4994399.1 oligosaccharide flippase family protein [Acinetobacter baumannii]MDC5561158.1 oligosaccharide flippase family protein [Acinetobacter baumannii]WCS38189.1 oligosaccharide flippase family protein [Acinetobacter baumannii]